MLIRRIKAGWLVLSCLVCMVVLTGPAPTGSTGATDTPAPPAAPDPKTISELAVEHSRTRDALLSVEARLMLLSEKLFSSRLTVHCRSEIDTPFQLQAVELSLDGELAYRQELNAAPTIMSLKLFDGYLAPGRHTLELKAYARGPNEPADAPAGYFAGGGLTVHLRNLATTEAVFELEGDGKAPDKNDLMKSNPKGRWKIIMSSRYETTPKK